MTFARRPLPSRYVNRRFIEGKSLRQKLASIDLDWNLISLTCAIAGLSSPEILFRTSSSVTQAPAEAEPDARIRVEGMMTEENWCRGLGL